jgi:YHS domain-containing protein
MQDVSDEKTARLKREHKGTTYYFSAPGCKKTVEGAPDNI